LPDRFNTKTLPQFNVTVFEGDAVGTYKAVTAVDPRVAGFQLHVAVYGPLPEVATLMHPAMRFPCEKNVTLPAYVTVATKDVADLKVAVERFDADAE
jgi:hypothetical protein